MKLSSYFDKSLDILYKIASNEDGSPASRIQAAEALAHLSIAGPPYEEPVPKQDDKPAGGIVVKKVAK